MKNRIKDRNFSLSTVQITPIKILSEYKKSYLNKNINSNYNRSDLINDINKISKFNLHEQINNNHNYKEDNGNKAYNINNGSSILIKSYHDSFKKKNHYLNKPDYFCINKNQRISDREKKKEKEPIDNIQKKNKMKNGEEINIVTANNNSNFRLIKKKEELNKIADIQKYKKMSAMNSDKNKKDIKNKTNNKDSINISIYKNINFDQPNGIIPVSKKSSSKIITQLIKSESYSDNEKLNKFNKKNNKNNCNHERYKSMNYANDKSNKKNKVELYNEKVMNYLYRKQDETSKINREGNNDNKKENKIKEGISIYNSTEMKPSESNKLNPYLNNNAHIKVNSMFDEMISIEEILTKGEEKKPKNNKKSENKKKLKNINSSNIKIKLEKSKNESKDNFKWITQIQKPLINNKRNNKIDMKLGKNSQNRIYKSNVTKYLNINKTTDENQNVLKKRLNLINKKNNNILLTKGLQNQLNKKNPRLKSSISFNYINNKSKIMKNSKSKDNKNKFDKKQGIIPVNDEELYYRNNSYDYDNMNDEMNRTPKKKSIFNRVKPNKLIEAFRKELADNSKKENVIKLKKNLKV